MVCVRFSVEGKTLPYHLLSLQRSRWSDVRMPYWLRPWKAHKFYWKNKSSLTPWNIEILRILKKKVWISFLFLPHQLEWKSLKGGTDIKKQNKQTSDLLSGNTILPLCYSYCALGISSLFHFFPQVPQNEQPTGVGVDALSSIFNHSSADLYCVCYPLTAADLEVDSLCLLSPNPNRGQSYQNWKLLND